MKNLIRRYPLSAYFALAYFVPWSVILYVSDGLKVQGEGVMSQGFSGKLILIWVAMLIGPSLAGLLLKRMVDGRAGLKEMLSQMFHWKVGTRWYLAALLLFPALVAPILYSFTLISPNYTPGLMVVAGVGAGLVGGFFEEIGWTGFALPKLQLKYSPFVAGILLGLIHTVWHLPADYWGAISLYKEFYLLHFLLWVAALTAFRLIAVWIFNGSNSLLMAQLAHGSYTGSQIVFGPPAVSATQDLVWYTVFSAALWLVAAIVVFQNKKMFFQKPAINL